MTPPLALDLPALIEELGVLLVEADQIRAYPPDYWVIVVAETIGVDLWHAADEAKLVLSAELGLPPAAAEAETWKLMLQVNALWRENGGLRMALDEAGGTLTQTYDVPLDGLNAELLAAIVRSFSLAAWRWRQVIATEPSPAGGETFAQPTALA